MNEGHGADAPRPCLDTPTRALTMATASKERRHGGLTMSSTFTPLLQRGLVLLLAMGMALPFHPSVLAQPALSSTFTQAIDRQKEVIESLSRGLDPAGFDPEALGLELAFDDAESIAAYLADRLRYEAYVGLLRGAQGTMVSGSGNAMDLSFLLAVLLTDAGYDVRLAQGRLPEAEARRLLQRMFQQSNAALDTTDATALARLAEATGQDEADLRSGVVDMHRVEITDTSSFQEASSARHRILSALAEADVDLGGSVEAELVEEASTYVWVEFRQGGSQSWAELHPAFGHEPPPVVQAVDYLEDDIPSSLQHRLRIEVMVERKQGDAFDTVALMTPWERPVANLIGQTLSVGNQPLGEAGSMSLQELAASAADAAFYVPMLNGSLAPGGLAFDTMGSVLDVESASSAMAGVFQTGARRVNDAIGALGGLGSDEPVEEAFALVAQWVDFVFIAPGGSEVRHRRYVFDRLSPEDRAAGGGRLLGQEVLLEGILNHQSFQVVAGAVSDDYLASELSRQALSGLEALERIVQIVMEDGGELDIASLAPLINAVESKDHLSIISAFDAVGASEGGVAYRAEPSLVLLRSALTPGEAPVAAMGVDILAHARRFLRLADGAIVADAQQAVLAGTWETEVERAYLARLANDVQGSYAAFAASASEVVVRPGDVAALAGLDLPTEALPALHRDLEAGYALVLPQGTLPEGTGFAWWRVDPVTGQTLGVAADGRGAAATEYSVPLWVSATFAGLLAVPGALACAAGAGGTAMALCFCDLLVTTGAALALGALAASLFSSAWAALFIIGDVGIGTVLAIPGLFTGPCSFVAGSRGLEPLCLVV